MTTSGLPVVSPSSAAQVEPMAACGVDTLMTLGATILQEWINITAKVNLRFAAFEGRAENTIARTVHRMRSVFGMVGLSRGRTDFQSVRPD